VGMALLNDWIAPITMLVQRACHARHDMGGLRPARPCMLGTASTLCAG
jgi:hypothetical protein